MDDMNSEWDYCDRCGFVFHKENLSPDNYDPKLLVCNKCNDKLPEDRRRRDS